MMYAHAYDIRSTGSAHQISTAAERPLVATAVGRPAGFPRRGVPGVLSAALSQPGSEPLPSACATRVPSALPHVGGACDIRLNCSDLCGLPGLAVVPRAPLDRSPPD